VRASDCTPAIKHMYVMRACVHLTTQESTHEPVVPGPPFCRVPLPPSLARALPPCKSAPKLEEESGARARATSARDGGPVHGGAPLLGELRRTLRLEDLTPHALRVELVGLTDLVHCGGGVDRDLVEAQVEARERGVGMQAVAQQPASVL